MSAAIASRRSPVCSASARYSSSSAISTRIRIQGRRRDVAKACAVLPTRPQHPGRLAGGMKYLCLLALAACLIPILGGDSTAAAPVALDPQLERAVQAATRDAARDGITIQITSGVRTRAHQQQLLDEAIETYGSEAVARQYVNTPERSTHVQGLAVDVGPTDAAY